MTRSWGTLSYYGLRWQSMERWSHAATALWLGAAREVLDQGFALTTRIQGAVAHGTTVPRMGPLSLPPQSKRRFCAGDRFSFLDRHGHDFVFARGTRLSVNTFELLTLPLSSTTKTVLRESVEIRRKARP